MMVALPKYLYYMAPVTPNAQLILCNGIKPRNLVSGLIPGVRSLADPGVIRLRAKKTIHGVPLHNYVPLYWATHTPMQHNILQNGIVGRDDLVFFVCDSAEVLSMLGVLTTDGNAASDSTQFWTGEGASSAIDWRVVAPPNAYSAEYRRKKMAEVLVPNCVPPECFVQVIVHCERTRQALMAMGSATAGHPIHSRPKVEVKIDQSLY